MAEVNASPDHFFRWTVDSKLHEAHAAVCEYLHLPPKNLVFVENATTGKLLYFCVTAMFFLFAVVQY